MRWKDNSELAKTDRARRRHYPKFKEEFNYTLKDIGKITGHSERTLKNKVAAGEIFPKDLVSVSKFIVSHVLNKELKSDARTNK